MFIDGLTFAQGSVVNKLTIASGSEFPASPSDGEMFHKTGDGLYVNRGGWKKLDHKDPTEKRQAVAGSVLDLAQANLFTKTISGATTFSVSNVPATNDVVTVIVELTNGGSSTVSWWANIKWPGGTAPTLTAAGVDVVGFYSYNAGTSWVGFLLGKDVK